MSSYRSVSAWDDFPVHQSAEYVRHPARFTYDDPDRGPQEGYGLYEHGFFGPFPKLGLTDRGDLFG